MGTPRDTVYSRGKGINKQKTNKQIKCVCLVKSAVNGDPAGYCVLAGKRNKQAKDKQTNKMRLFGQKRSL